LLLSGAMRRTNATSLVAIALIAIASPIYAGSSTAEMTVSARVIARTILTVDSQPASVSVTAEDILRGYVDVPQAVTFRVRSNARDGYALGFQPLNFPFSAAEVRWNGRTTTVQSGNDWATSLTHPYQQGGSAGALVVRLRLSAGAEPGTYSWPLQFAADSL